MSSIKGVFCTMTGESRWWHSILLLLMLLARLMPLASCTSSPSSSPPPVKTFPPDPPIPPNIKGGAPPPPASTYLHAPPASSPLPMPSSSSLEFFSSHLSSGQAEAPAHVDAPSSSTSLASSSPLTDAKRHGEQPETTSLALSSNSNEANLLPDAGIRNTLSSASSSPLTSSSPKYSPSSLPPPSSFSSSSLSSSLSSTPPPSSSPSIVSPSSSSQNSSNITTNVSQEVIKDKDDSHKGTSLSSNSNSPSHNGGSAKEESHSLTSSKPRRAKLSEKDTKILQTLEKMFLKNAGMQRRPKLGPDAAVPHYMLDLYQAQFDLGGHSDTFHKVKGRGHIAANTVRSFVHEDTDVKACQPPLCARIRFDISTLTKEESLTGAELRIFVGEASDDELPDSSSLTPPAQSAEAGAIGEARKSQVGESSLTRLEIHQIMKPSSLSASITSSSMPPATGDDAIMRLLDTRLVDARNTSWHSFDVHPAVLRWKRLGQPHNYGLEVRLVPAKPAHSKTLTTGVKLSTDSHVRVRRATHLADRAWALQRPLLVTFTDDGVSPPLFSQSSSPSSFSSSKTKSPSSRFTSARSSKTTLQRRRRSTNNSKKKKDSAKDVEKKKRRRNRRRNRRKKKKKRRRKKKGNKNICQRHSLYVDFSNVGWDDWIVAPSGYSAYFCHGECTAPIPDFAKASNHAMLQARVYKVNPGAVPKVCCVPIKMSSISLLYLDENNQTVLKNYQDMSVDECGCK